MDRDFELKNALKELSRVINETIEQSASVRGAVENLRELGFEPNLSMRLEVGLEAIVSVREEESADPELELTPEDIRALRRMRIAF